MEKEPTWALVASRAVVAEGSPPLACVFLVALENSFAGFGCTPMSGIQREHLQRASGFQAGRMREDRDANGYSDVAQH